MRLFGKPLEVGDALPLGVVTEALQAAVAERGQYLEVDPARRLVRVFGPPGSLDPFLPVDLWFGPGIVELEARVPVVVPSELRAGALELALWLTGEGRFAVIVDPHGRPFLRGCLKLRTTGDEVAQNAVAVTLDLLVERAAVAEESFRSLVQGASVAECVPMDADLPFVHVAAPWSEPPVQPAAWDVRPSEPVRVPENTVPDGYTAEEFASTCTTFVAMSEDDARPGLVEACAGPVLIHADGAVECFGCVDPQASRHLKRVTVACAPGLELGNGHRCERCADPNGASE